MKRATLYRVVVGQVLALHRVRRGAGQAELAMRLGLTQGSWSRIERGEAELTVERLRKVGRVLDVCPAAVLDQAEDAVLALETVGIVVIGTSDDPRAADLSLAPLSAAAVGSLIAPSVDGWAESQSSVPRT